MSIIVATLIFSVILAFVLGSSLGLFRELFRVERDPMIDTVRAALPGVNCGGCGYPGCDGYAEAVVMKVTGPDKCTAGGKGTAEAVAKLVGGSVAIVDTVSFLLCQGTKSNAASRGDYSGVRTCRAARLSVGGIKQCAWGCQGFGDCVSVCKFDALSMGADGLPVVDYENCTGCGMCVEECPQKLFVRLPRDSKGPIPLCSNRNPVKANVIKACKTGCIKCEACVRACTKGAITMKNGLPVVDASKCDACGECIKKCPTKVFRLHEEICR